MQNSILQIQQTTQLNSKNVNCDGRGAIGTVSAGTTGNVDYTLSDDCIITGGMLRSLNSAFGDSANFQIVDVNNVLGYGNNVVLNQFLTNWYMVADRQEQMNENFPYPAKIITGLVLRVVYTSTGTSDVTICANYRLHKILP
jgi:hypothetical protein